MRGSSRARHRSRSAGRAVRDRRLDRRRPSRRRSRTERACEERSACQGQTRGATQRDLQNVYSPLRWPPRPFGKRLLKRPSPRSPKRNHRANGKSSRKARAPADVVKADPALFDPLTPGEIADALRTLTEDRRLASMAKVGRYRVICTEPLVVKPPHWMAGHRLARVVAYDYASRSRGRCVRRSRCRRGRGSPARQEPADAVARRRSARGLDRDDRRARARQARAWATCRRRRSTTGAATTQDIVVLAALGRRHVRAQRWPRDRWSRSSISSINR